MGMPNSGFSFLFRISKLMFPKYSTQHKCTSINTAEKYHSAISFWQKKIAFKACRPIILVKMQWYILCMVTDITLLISRLYMQLSFIPLCIQLIYDHWKQDQNLLIWTVAHKFTGKYLFLNHVSLKLIVWDDQRLSRWWGWFRNHKIGVIFLIDILLLQHIFPVCQECKVGTFGNNI